MNKLEVFIDYSCPFCKSGYGYLKELLPEFPNAVIELKPVEAHPKVEEPGHRPWVDLAVQGGLYAKAVGGDETAYAERLIKLIHTEDRQSVEDIGVLSNCAADAGLDATAFREALESGAYENALAAANDYAYETQKVWAVPTFVCGEKRLDAAPNVGVTKERLRGLLQELYN
ncbi:MAG: DsbA family protein [Oscillospiraceae bacterium]|jgi:predicted DsbA family dithiol-disulfide isomerase|nr:DsbA family protein [Oscillospiraceae bacterium]